MEDAIWDVYSLQKFVIKFVTKVLGPHLLAGSYLEYVLYEDPFEQWPFEFYFWRQIIPALSLRAEFILWFHPLIARGTALAFSILFPQGSSRCVNSGQVLALLFLRLEALLFRAFSLPLFFSSFLSILGRYFTVLALNFRRRLANIPRLIHLLRLYRMYNPPLVVELIAFVFVYCSSSLFVFIVLRFFCSISVELIVAVSVLTFVNKPLLTTYIAPFTTNNSEMPWDLCHHRIDDNPEGRLGGRAAFEFFCLVIVGSTITIMITSRFISYWNV